MLTCARKIMCARGEEVACWSRLVAARTISPAWYMCSPLFRRDCHRHNSAAPVRRLHKFAQWWCRAITFLVPVTDIRKYQCNANADLQNEIQVWKRVPRWRSTAWALSFQSESLLSHCGRQKRGTPVAACALPLTVICSAHVYWCAARTQTSVRQSSNPSRWRDGT